MKQEQLEKEGIKVGGYYVVRRGKRVAVMTPGDPAYIDGYGFPVAVEDPDIEIIFTETQARHLLGAEDRLRTQQKEKDADKQRIEQLRAQISKLDDELFGLETKSDEEVAEDFKGYDIELADDGIEFGCTTVTKENLRAIKKLLDKGTK